MHDALKVSRFGSVSGILNDRRLTTRTLVATIGCNNLNMHFLNISCGNYGAHSDSQIIGINWSPTFEGPLCVPEVT